MDAKVDLLPEQGSAVVSDARSVFEHQLVETLYRDSSASRSDPTMGRERDNQSCSATAGFAYLASCCVR